MPSLSKYALWIEPRDVWCVKLDPIWIEFLGVRSVGQNKAVPFIDAVPITFWIHGKPDKVNVSVLFNRFKLFSKNFLRQTKFDYQFTAAIDVIGCQHPVNVIYK